MQNVEKGEGVLLPQAHAAGVASLRPEAREKCSIVSGTAVAEPHRVVLEPWRAVRRIACFFALIIALVFLMNFIITSGLRRIQTSGFGVSNQVMESKVNAQVVITGSSRALSHYDPRIIEAVAGHSAFNLGKNGSQTDMQVAFLKAYLAHNQKPELVIHNLDAFSFVSTHEVFDPVEYTPYLYDHNLYDALWKINPSIWKSRYLPLYGYVVEDMNFSWILGVKGFFGWSPPEDYYLGFNPRSKKWTDEFQRLKASNRQGVRFEIEPGGAEALDELVRLCKQNQIQLIFVYSPEYIEMQSLTQNRAEIFHRFQELATHYDVPLWDYSNWEYAADQDFFQNSQHLNDVGAAAFSKDLANRLDKYFVARTKTAGDLQAAGAAVRSNVGQN